VRRALRAVTCAVLVLVTLAGASAWAGTSGGGVQRWAASYLDGAPAFSTATAVSPDGSTVFVTGTTAFGPSGRFATLAYDDSTGAQKWVANFPGSSSPEWGRGNAIAVSPDGSTVFVTGSSSCSRCGAASFDGYSTLAYDASTGARLWVARYASDGHPYSLAVSPDGTKLFVNGQDAGGTASATVAYDTSSGQQLWAVPGDNGPVYWGGGLSVSPDSSTVYVAGTAQASGDNACSSQSGGYHTAAYDAADGTVRWSATHQVAGDNLCGTATSLGMSPDGSTVLVTGYGGSRTNSGRYGSGTVAYDALTGTQLWATQDDNISVLDGDTVVSLGVSPDGSKVFVLGDDCAQYPTCVFATVAYDRSSGDRLWVSRYDGGGRGYAGDLAVSPDGSAVFVTGQETMPCLAPCTTAQIDAPLVAYDDETGDVRWATSYTNNHAWALAASPDGSSVYLAGTFTASNSTSSTAGVGAARLAARTGSGSCSTGMCGYSTARYNTGPGPGTFQDRQPSLRYNGWRNFFHKTAIGSAYRASNVRGDTATFTTPAATSIAWLTHRGPSQGKAKVTVDGHRKGTFNLYGATESARSITFNGLARKAHTIKVTVLGRKDASSKGTWVAVDGFKVKVGTSITQDSSAKIHYDSWTGMSTPTASGGSYRISGTPAARMSLDFTGRTIKWITATGPAYGRARVVIDGKAHTVDLYRRTRHWKTAVSYTGLSKGRHHIMVRPLGTKNTSSSSKNIVVDAFVVRS